MDYLKIKGGAPLNGTIKIGGAKNAALPLLFSTLLCEGEHTLTNVPQLEDIRSTQKLLEELGLSWEKSGDKVTITRPQKINTLAPYNLVRKMRASILCLGPILAREGYAKVSLPGGCAIGSRPIDLHLEALKKMGAEIEITAGYVIAKCAKLKGTDIYFDFPTVGGTENILMAATLAEGTTHIQNAAREPEIVNLADQLIAMGAQISGAGSSTITIEGVTSLKPCSHKVRPDRIVAGTYICAGAMTQGTLRVEGFNPEDLKAFLEKLKKVEVQFDLEDHAITVTSSTIQSTDMQTQPHPGFPTDLQAQYMAMMCLAPGRTQISENIFENRFMHVQELERLGANIKIEANKALVTGGTQLTGAPVMATDLRASACLVLAGLVAHGTTEIRRIYHLDRGYAGLVEKLQSVGAQIERLSE